MERKNGSILLCFWQILRLKLFRMRTGVFLLLQTFILYLYLKPLLRFSKAAHYPASPWSFPFLISNLYFLFLFMIGIVYFFSDVPFMQYQNMYQVIRVGRKKWAIAEILSIAAQAVLIMLYQFLASVCLLVGHLELTADWGKLLHTAALTNAGSQYGFLFGFRYDAMQASSPVCLTFIALGIGSLLLLLIGLVMFAVSLCINRGAAVAVAIMMVVQIYFVENTHPYLALAMSKIAPVSWMRVAYIGMKKYGKYFIPTLSYMLVVLAAVILAVMLLILWKVKRVEFQWVKEE